MQRMVRPRPTNLESCLAVARPHNGESLSVSCRVVLRQSRTGVIKSGLGLIPEGEPLVVGAQDAQVGDLVGVFGQPGGAGLLEPGLEHMAMAALDHP
jgi:hypothetical protein